MQAKTVQLLQAYYAAFNRQDWEGMLALLADDVAHDVNQGSRETGIDAFRAFLARMDRCYSEQVTQLMVMATDDGCRAAAEFVIEGVYKTTDGDFLPATGQRYTLPVGAFFDIRDGKIARVTNYYNLEDWLAQVGAVSG
ncbi:MAG: nuclear transport factor 2 family protein [Pseudomonadales bacterium]|nr:nuclear transport factor 2 family protein [Pseudomonadales bacterium]